MIAARTPRVSRSHILGALLLGALGPPAPLDAGGWVAEEGSWSLSYHTIFTWFDEVELHDGRTGKPGDTEWLSSSVTAEHVPREGLAITAVLPFELSARDGATPTVPGFDARKPESGFGDGRLAVRLRLFDEFTGDPLTGSVSVGLKVPLSDYDENKLHSIGDGQTDLELRFAGGRIFPLWGLDHYASLEAGYRWRLDDPANEVFITAEFGTFITSHVSGRLFLDHVDSLGGLGLESPEFAAKAAAEGKPPFPRVEEDFTKLGLGVSVRLSDEVDLSVFYARTIEAENTAWDTATGVSFSVRF